MCYYQHKINDKHGCMTAAWEETCTTSTVWLTAAEKVRRKSLPNSLTSSIIPLFGRSLMVELLSKWKKKKAITSKIQFEGGPIWNLAEDFVFFFFWGQTCKSKFDAIKERAVSPNLNRQQFSLCSASSKCFVLFYPPIFLAHKLHLKAEQTALPLTKTSTIVDPILNVASITSILLLFI